ncbi:MAG: heavy metal translocating P-type ATPase, partial [Xanthomonadales bacterium]|nr:heavy metal translocating P-type ATPase [Xanthomonadales bacterium]
GVTVVSVNLANREVSVESFVSNDALIAAVASAGYEAVIDEVQSIESDDRANQEKFRVLIRKTTLALAVGGLLMIFGMLAPAIGPEWDLLRGLWLLVTATTAAVMYYAGRHYFTGAWKSLQTRSATMDTLIALGTGTAWLYSTIIVLFPELVPEIARHVYFEAAVIIIGMVNLGQALEQKARGRTSQAIRRLLDLQQKTARLVRDGEEIDIAITEVVKGDLIRVRPGEQVAVDGVVTEGQTNIDESMLTGEPMPVTKSSGDEVSAGTLNKTGTVVYRATRVGADTALARIIKMVRQAQNSKPPIGKMADSIAAVFVPVVMLIAIIAAVVWFLIGPEPSGVYAIVTAVTVLIIACPCALGLATPMSVMVGIGKAAEAGVLIRNGEALQTASKLTTMVLDKTGTITAGRPEIIEIDVFDGHTRNQALMLAASLEAGSEHPLAQAFTQAAIQRGLELVTVDGFMAIAGMGIRGEIDNRQLLLGNEKLMVQGGVLLTPDALKTSNRLAEKAWTPMFLAVDGQLSAIIAVADPIKEDSAEAIKRLQAEGLKVVMLTGDNRHTAEAVARQLGIDEIRAEVLPEDKKNQIAELQNQGEQVGMVGDGINDAPALALANVGFAIGTGTDVAIESADITLMRCSLHGVADAMEISTATMRNIRQNLFGAFLYNSAGIPIAAGVLYPLTGMLLNPIIAGTAMAFSSVTVVSNANRLRLFKFGNQA